MIDADLKALLASLIESQKRTDEQLARTDAQVARTEAKLGELFAGSDGRLAKLEQLFAESDGRLAKLEQLFAKGGERLAELEQLFAKTDAQMARTDAKLERVSELVGNISNNQGDIAEEFFYRSLKHNPHVGPLHFEDVSRHWKYRKARLEDEFDIVLLNGDSVGLVEVKTKAHFSEVDKLIEKKVPHFRLLFPDYANHKIYPVLATLAVQPELEQRAAETGVLLLTQQGEHIALAQAQARAY